MQFDDDADELFALNLPRRGEEEDALDYDPDLYELFMDQELEEEEL